MEQGSKVIAIYLDAFSSRYLTRQKAPFLWQLSQEGLYFPLRPMFAFSGIGAAMFSGTFPNTNKIWTDYVFRSEKGSMPRLFKLLIAVCNLIPNDILNQYSRYPIYKMFGQDFGIPNVIPPPLLDYFELKQTKKYTEENSLGQIPTLFDQLRTYGIKYLVSGLSESIFDNIIMGKASKAIEEDFQFILFKLGALDKLGHKFGPESKEISRKLLEIDDFLGRFVNKASKLEECVFFVIFSDHDMSPVLKTTNLLEMMKRLPLKMVDDYLLFLNSTVVSFLFKSQSAKEIVGETLSKVDFGQILDETRLKELGIDEIGSAYGELIFGLNEGEAFFPDFYRKHCPPKGMHGYPYPRYSTPILLIYPPNAAFETKEVARHIDIMPTILDLLNVPIPPTCEGKSLLRKN